MKKIWLVFTLSALSIFLAPINALAAGISASSSGGKYVGDDVTVSIVASGTTFNAFSGSISISGPVKVNWTTPGDALWVSKPNGAGSFAGALTNPTGSFKIATISLRGTGVGTGTVSISGVKLANKGPVVGNDGGSTSFSFARRPTPPGSITVASSSHPDQNTAYEATAIALSWDKPSGVTGFSYLLDQAAETTPPTKITSAETTVSFDNQAVGTYYFHIRALNGDGWGPTSHFKVTIKEPDPKIKEDIDKPHDIQIKIISPFANNIIDGTFSGISISGVTLPDYTANILLEPAPALPEGKKLSVKADPTGKFEYLIDYPIKAGVYKLVIQGQDNKILTPVSNSIRFEISQAKGGSVNILTEADTLPPVIPVPKWYEKINYQQLSAFLGILLIGSVGFMCYVFVKKRRNKN